MCRCKFEKIKIKAYQNKMGNIKYMSDQEFVGEIGLELINLEINYDLIGIY